MSVMLLALSGVALARPAPALLEVDNDFEGEVEVYVDGRYEGTVPGDRALRMDVPPGRRGVVVQRPRGGAVLLSTTLHFQHGVIAGLEVQTPHTSIRVRNVGSVPLSVDFGPGDDVWVAPNSAAEVRVPAGTLSLTASARDRDGLSRVRAETLWLEPGQRHEHVFDYTPPPPTRLSLWNPSPERLRALVEGQEVGWLAPGETRLVAVDPGRTEVRFYDRSGRLESVFTVRAERGERTQVVAATSSPRPAHPHGHGARPAAPVRATSSSTCSSRPDRVVAVR
jgi:hypothetical protein